MAIYTFFSVHNCLDAEFDAVDAAADHELCRAIVAGRMGLHPDAWGAHDLLSTLPPRIRAWEPEPYERLYHPSPADLKADPPPAHGEIQLTCDVCERHRLGMTLEYRGDRAEKVAAIRALGHQHGWTCIAGIDRCPACSRVVEPDPVGNGAGGDQSNEQHA